MSTSLYLNLPYRVKDIKLYNKGLKDIEWVKREMPGINQLYQDNLHSKPLKGMRICVSLDITIHSALCIEILYKLGAEVRCCASNIYSTQDHAAAYIAHLGIPIFAWSEMNLTDYWWAMFESCHFNSKGPTHIIDGKGDLNLMIHKGIKSENNSTLLDEQEHIASKIELNLFLKRIMAEDQKCWNQLAQDLKGITIDTQTARKQVKKQIKYYQEKYTIIDLNTSIIKRKIDNYYSCKETIAESIKRSTRTMLIGKSVLICGFGDIGRGCAESLKLSGASISIAETDPMRALEAALEGYKVVQMDNICENIDLFITATGTGENYVIELQHMQRMKDHAIIYNMGHSELEIDYESLHNNQEIKKIVVDEQLDRYYFPNGHSILIMAESKLANLSYETPQLSFFKSASFSILIQMQILLNEKSLHKGVHSIPYEIDKAIAKMHLNKIDAHLTLIK